MRRNLLAVVATMFAVVAVAADDPLVGTWKLNVAKSKGSRVPKSQIITITAQENGIKVVDEGLDTDGKAFHVGFAGKYDGKDYPLPGSSFADTVALKQIDINTHDVINKKDGKEVWNEHSFISKDGKTYTRTIKTKGSDGEEISKTLIYDKQ